jgi:hypothetical protein
VRGLRRNKSKKEERKEKTLQSAARVEKEIPVRARHWREPSAMDIIRKTGKKKMMKKEGERQAARKRRKKGESAPAATARTHSRSLSTANERPLPVNLPWD